MMLDDQLRDVNDAMGTLYSYARNQLSVHSYRQIKEARSLWKAIYTAQMRKYQIDAQIISDHLLSA